MTSDELAAEMESLGQPQYRTQQLLDWVYRKGVTDPARMSNLPGALTARFEILTSRVALRSDGSDGTMKLLLALRRGQHIECVLIPTQRRATACLSTQAGCSMACSFCASGLGGLKRNLGAGEMIEQVLHLQREGARQVTHVVFMGTGEPLANYDATVAAVRAVVDPHRLGISGRRVTVSTVGLPKQIRRLAAEDLPITLAISLHAPNDAIRRKLMPAAARAPIEEILAAAEVFFRSRNRRVTLEYVLLAGVNDTNVCAEGLARIAKRLCCNVNLILYNPVDPLPYRRPGEAEAAGFADRLRKRGVSVQVRRSRGLDASAACGQLRATTLIGSL